MITLPELLDNDVRFAKYFQKVPRLPPVASRCSTPPWRILFKTHDHPGWMSRNARTYADAFRFIVPLYKKLELIDGAIVCRRMQFGPPQRIVRIKGKYTKNAQGESIQLTRLVDWKPQIPTDESWHNWCPYCRRPTVFAYFRKHHALPSNKDGKGVDVDPSVLRCSICGASERLVTLK